MPDTAEQPPEAIAGAAAVAAPNRVPWMNLWTAAGGLAGAAAVVYGVGFGIEALRLNAAGLAVSEAIAVVPKTAMVSLAINAIFLKVVIQGILTGAFMVWLKSRAEALLTPEAFLGRRERKNVRKRRWQAIRTRLGSLAEPFRWLRILLGRVIRALHVYRAATAVRAVSRRILRAVATVWRRTLAHVPYKLWIALAMVYTFFLPWTWFILYATPIAILQVRALSAVSRRHDAGLMSIRAEAILLGVVTACSVASMTLIGEAVRPGPLPRVAVQVDGASKPIFGDYVATTNDGVYLGVHRKLTLIPDHRVTVVTIYDAAKQKPEKARTLVERLR